MTKMVKVRIEAGCTLCGSKVQHEHTWEEWDRHVHGDRKDRK